MLYGECVACVFITMASVFLPGARSSDGIARPDRRLSEACAPDLCAPHAPSRWNASHAVASFTLVQNIR